MAFLPQPTPQHVVWEEYGLSTYSLDELTSFNYDDYTSESGPLG